MLFRRTTVGIAALAVVAGLLSSSAAADDSAPAGSPPQSPRAQALAAWRLGGETVRSAAETALAGSDAQVDGFLSTGLAAAAKEDDRLAVLKMAGSSGPGVRAAAAAVLAGQQDAHAFLESGWQAPWAQDQKVAVLRAISGGGPAVQTAGSKALDTGTTDAYLKFLGTGLARARAEDDRVQVLRLINVGGPRTQEAGSAALDAGPDAVREFLETGQYVVRAQDQEAMTIGQLLESTRQSAGQSRLETEAAKEASSRALDAARLAKDAAQRAKDETAAAQAAGQDASAAAGRAATAAEAAAQAATTAVDAANQASSAARNAASAAAAAAAASSAAGRAAARANDAATAAGQDRSRAEAATQAAKDARTAALAADTSAKALIPALTALKEAGNATLAAHDASVHADEAATAAAEAADHSNVSDAQSRRAKIAADKAKRAAATARQAADRAKTATDTAITAANEAKAAAERSAQHAQAAAAAAEEAAAHAGESAGQADLAIRHADAANQAATDAQSAADQAATVEATARQVEQDTLESTTALSVLAAEEQARQDAETQAQAAWERAEQTRQDQDTVRLLAEATAPGTGPATAVAKGRQAAVHLMKNGAPWTAASAETALTGGDPEVLNWLTTQRRLASEQDDYSKVTNLAFSDLSALRTAAEQTLTKTPQEQAAFLETGQHTVLREEYRVRILALINDGGPAVRTKASAALDTGTPEALLAFLTTGQYTARREDDRVEALRLSDSGTPRVKAAAQVALAAPDSMLHAFLTRGQYVIAQQDHEDATHVAEMRRLVAEAKGLAAQARQHAAEAAEAAATAQGAADQAAAAAQQATNAAADADRAATDAKSAATAAEASAKSAIDSLNRAKAAAAAAGKSEVEAKSSSYQAANSASHARAYALMAQISATQARNDAIAADKSAAEARAAGEEAFNYALELSKREEEQRRKLEQTPSDPNAPPLGGVSPDQSGLQQYYVLGTGLAVLQLGDTCYLNGYEVKSPPKGCQAIAASFDEWLSETAGELSWAKFDWRKNSPKVQMAMLLYSYCHWQPMGTRFEPEPYSGYCGGELQKQLDADGGSMMITQEAGIPRQLVKPLLRSLGIGAARTTFTLEELAQLSPAYRNMVQLGQLTGERLLANVRLYPLSNQLDAAGTLGPKTVTGKAAELAKDWKRFGNMPREEFVNKYWNPRAYLDNITNEWKAGWNYPGDNYAIEGTRKMLSAGSIKAGTVWDRFGESNGKWLSPAAENASFASRSIPPDSLGQPYLRYKWAKDYDEGAGAIEESKAARWFEQPGGATQYRLMNKNVHDLCIEGYLVFETGAPCT
ncbi:glycohydrolase toxin TNT-related protein [Kitasatospora cineracea]